MSGLRWWRLAALVAWLLVGVAGVWLLLAAPVPVGVMGASIAVTEVCLAADERRHDRGMS